MPYNRRSSPWAGLLPAAAVLLIAFGLRIWRLAIDAIWWDEGFSVYMARLPMDEMLFQTANDAHPPLSYAAQHLWIAAAGDTPFALRMFSVLCGVLAVAFVYQAGREIGGRQVGLLAALLMASARLTVWWSQEIRMYAPAMLLAAAALWLALRIFLGRPGLWINAAGLALATAAGLLSLYLFAGVVIALNLSFSAAFLLARERWRLVLAWGASQAAVLAMFLPWWFYAQRYLPSWESPQAPVSLGQVLLLYLSTIFTGIATNIERYNLILALAAAALIACAWVTYRQGRAAAWITLLIGCLLPPLLVYALSIPRGQFNYPTPSPRYFVLLAAPVYLLMAWGAVELNKRFRHSGSLLLAALLSLFAWSVLDYMRGLRGLDDYASMAAALEALRRPDDAVVLNNDTDWPIFAYHYQQPFDRHISQHEQIGDWKYAAGLLERYRGSSEGVWLVQTRYAEVTDPNNELGRWLEERSWNQRRYVFPEGQLWFFAMTPERGLGVTIERAAGWPVDFTPVARQEFAPGAWLAGYSLPLKRVEAGSQVTVGLGWQLDQGGSGEWDAAAALIGADGQEISRTALRLRGIGPEQRYVPVSLFVPPDVPAQRAQLVFIAGEVWQPLSPVTITTGPPALTASAEIPSDAQPAAAQFGSAISLAGVELPELGSFSPGEGIPLTLYWQANQPISERYKVFVHLVGTEYNPATNNSVWGQQDQEPQGGAAPTSGWRAGQIVADAYLVQVSTDAPAGQYTLQVGLYLPLGGGRLPLFIDGQPQGDTFTLGVVTIR